MSGQKGRSGRNRKPLAIRKLEGNRSKRKLRDELVTFGAPDLPSYFNEEERMLWASIQRYLPEGFLKRSDTAVLERMCVAWANFRDVNRQIAKIGMMVRGGDGNAVRNPLLVIRRQCVSEMHLAGEALGLSPVARTRLISAPVESDDPMQALLEMDGDADGPFRTH